MLLNSVCGLWGWELVAFTADSGIVDSIVSNHLLASHLYGREILLGRGGMKFVLIIYNVLMVL